MDLTFKHRAQGCFLGLAIADALGAPVEFLAPGTFTPVRDFAPTPRWGLEAGQWTDDTAMALCLGEALIDCGGYDSHAVMQSYLNWYRDGKYTPQHHCFDIGSQTREALNAYEIEPQVSSLTPRTNAAGNGTIMRLAPLAIASFHGGDEAEAADAFALSARDTHYSHEAEAATVIFGFILRLALGGLAKNHLLPTFHDSSGIVEELKTIAEEPVVHSRGYVRDSLKVAWQAFSTTDSFENCVLKAINTGYDTDTNGAIAGQIAGAYYGIDAIPHRWRRVWQNELIVGQANRLIREGSARIVASRFEADGHTFR